MAHFQIKSQEGGTGEKTSSKRIDARIGIGKINSSNASSVLIVSKRKKYRVEKEKKGTDRRKKEKI